MFARSLFCFCVFIWR